MRKALLLSLLSALLLILPWVGLSGVTALVGFVPLLIVSEGYGKGRRNFWKTFGWIALSFGIWSGVTTWWIWYAAPIGAILSVLITIGLFGGVFMLYHWVSKRAPKALAYTLLVAGWIACEYLYTIGEVSFPWLVLGNGFANDIKLVQWYDVTGVFGGTLWVWVINLLMYEALKSKHRKMWIASAVAVVLPVMVSLVRYYTYEETGKEVKVTVVQPNIDPYQKFYMGQQLQTDIMLDLARQAPVDVDFLVFPETAIHDDVFENSLTDDFNIEQFRNLLMERYPTAQIVVGADTKYYYSPGEKLSQTVRTRNGNVFYDAYNTALGVDTSQKVQIHHKSKLVVGVEKMPYHNVMKYLDFLIVDLGGTTGQYGVDSVRKVFTDANGVKAGAAICWEGVFGGYYSEFAANGAQLMFIISNDGWWSDTQGHRQLFRYARLRAVETRRAIGRSANTGTSGFINQRGDVLQKVGWEVTASITDTLHTNDKLTCYTRTGDLVARISVYVFLLCILYFIALSYKHRNGME